MEVTPFNATGSAGSAGLAGTMARDTDISRDAFLQLLITQLRYQDPLSPVENEAFLAQLAQFSSLEEMQKLNSSLEAQLSMVQSQANSSTTGLIGKHVRASGDQVTVGESGTTELGYFLPEGAANVEISVYDTFGATVKKISIVAPPGGSNQIEWDGLDDNGRRVDPGDYTFSVSASDVNGQSMVAATTVTGLVDGVTFQNGLALLIVNGREVPLSSVLDVFIPEGSAFDATDTRSEG